ncbi:MAG: asparagine synthase (glutamine-hydrolyzing) [Niabella sp.]
MSGISGYIVKGEPVKAENIMRMTEAIRHRGSDDEGYVCVGESGMLSYAGKDSMPEVQVKYPLINPDLQTSLALGFRRLATLDLSTQSHQPMCADSVAITFNGEIYNYQELRKKLEKEGQHFLSDGDAEVVLKAYLVWGIDMIGRLNGMFAITIVDLKLQTTFLIRDRLGIKPLFYYVDEKHITWCSEIKGILQVDWISPMLDMRGLILNYQFKSSVAPYSCFQNIYELSPGSYMTIDHDNLFVRHFSYWQIPVRQPILNVDKNTAVEMVKDKLKSVVRLQRCSDAPFISMMSGGIDSTLLTSLAFSQDNTLPCYTMSFDGSGNGMDELPQSRKMVERLGIKQQFVQQISDEDVVQNAIEYTSHFEEPYVAVDVVFNAAHFLNEKGFKVVLSGNGADAAFAGGGLYLNRWKQRQRFSFIRNFIPPFHDYLKKIRYHLNMPRVGDYYLSTTGGMRNYTIAALQNKYGLQDIQHFTHPFISEENFANDYEALFYYEVKYSVGAHHVYHDDICAMRFGVEMRYPYLDHELLELVACLPVSYRYDGQVSKPLLRELAAPFIDPENLRMSKKAFTLPLTRIMEQNRAFQHFVQEQIRFLKTTGLFNPKAIDGIIAEGGRTHLYRHTWQLVSTAIWMQKYL